MDLTQIRTKRNIAKRLMLKFAHRIQLLQNRNRIDYSSIAYECELYLQQYKVYKNMIEMENNQCN